MIQINLNSSNQKAGDVTVSGNTMSGDGTVTLHSALINGTVTENILYIHTENGVSAEHVELIKGNSDENVKFFDYVCDVISGVDVYSYNDSEFFNYYSGYKEVQ